ncbi:MAG: hypothetical protein AMXMBFR84_49440 [Candidatus Hydrogenedentota bacterium]
MDAWMNNAIVFLGWVIPTSMQAAVLVILVLLVQAFFKRQLTPRWTYALWFVVVVRLLMPTAPSSGLSVFNLLPLPDNLAAPMLRIFEHSETIAQGEENAPIVSQATLPLPPATPVDDSGTILSHDPNSAAMRQSAAQLSPQVSNVYMLWTRVWERMLGVWLAGLAALGVLMTYSNLSLLRRVRRCRPVTDPSILNVLEDCKDRLRVTTPISVVAVDWDRGPALFGWIRPRVLIPQSIAVAPDPVVLRHIFLHEVAHHKRHDILVNWLTSILLLVHWFNPLIWFAFYRMRTDRELACDALALSAAESEEAKAYGNTILNLLDRTRAFHAVPGVVGIVEGKSALKRRIAMIALFKKGSYGWSVLALAVLAVLACVGLTNARTENALKKSEEGVQARIGIAKADEPKPEAPEWARELLDTPVNIEFEDEHIQNVLGFVGEYVDANFVVDTRAVRPSDEVADSNNTEGTRLSGIVTSIKLSDVTLRAALSALLRPLGLDYAFEEGYFWISSPELLMAEGFVGQIGTKGMESGTTESGKPAAKRFASEKSGQQAGPGRPMDTIEEGGVSPKLRSQDQNQLKQMGIVFKMFANESEGGRFPAVDSRPGFLVPSKDEIYPEYVSDLTVMINPWKKLPKKGEADAYFYSDSYWYLPYAVNTEAMGMELIKAYESTVAKGEPLPDRWAYKDSDGNEFHLHRLKEGIERFFITDINDPAASAKHQSQIPVMFSAPTQFSDAGVIGGNVLFLDGHVEFVKFPGRFPMTPDFLQGLENLKKYRKVNVSSRSAGEMSEKQMIASDQNNLKQLGLVLKMFANEQRGEVYPKIDMRPGHVIMDKGSIYPEYLNDPNVLLSPWSERPDSKDIDAFFDDTSYWYIPYATQEEAAGLAFVKTYRTTVLKGQTLPEEVDFDSANGPQKMHLFREGIERYFITDINDPNQAAKQQSSTPVIVGRPRTWADGRTGGNVLYMDGHVEFVEFPGKYPMTSEFIGSLRGLDGIENANHAGAETADDKTSRLQIRWVAKEGDTANAETFERAGKEGSEAQVAVDVEVLIRDSDVAAAAVSPDTAPNSFVVTAILNEEAAPRLQKSSRENIGRKLAIIFDNRVVCTPAVRAEVGNVVQITGNFTKEQAEEIAHALSETSNDEKPAEQG